MSTTSNRQLYYSRFYDDGLIPISKEHLFEEIPNTWIPIVDKLIDDLFDAGWDGVVDQVKEKFGGLRFYTKNIQNEKINDLIDEAEEQSVKVCSVCGAPATTTTRGWVMYVCDDHKTK